LDGFEVVEDDDVRETIKQPLRRRRRAHIITKAEEVIELSSASENEKDSDTT
jgi:hypothetical protein